MKKSKLAEIRSETAKRLASARRRAEDSRMTAMAVRGTSALLSGAAIGMAEKKGAPMVVAGVPVRLAVGALAAFGEAFTRGPTSAALGGLSAASLATYGYEGARQGTFIAGVIGAGGNVHGRNYV